MIPNDADERELKKFHNQLKTVVRSPSNFQRNIDVGKKHIFERASETGRYVFNNESIAAVIYGGIVNTRKSKWTHPLRMAIEAIFDEVQIVDWEKKIEKTVKNLAVRVVIQEAKPKYFVVTVYPDDGSGDFDKTNLPEVSNEFWN